MVTDMNSRLFIEENGIYQIDFTEAKWVSSHLNDIFHASNTPMSDADVVIESIAELEDEDVNLVFVEYKNANIEGAVNPGAFDPAHPKKIDGIVRKYYDSLIYMMATKPKSRNSYVYILEYPNGDTTSRKLLRNKISERLPFKLQRNEEVKVKLIDKFEVLSIDEWNSHPAYGKYPITKVSKGSTL
jgi:hypothetical protein